MSNNPRKAERRREREAAFEAQRETESRERERLAARSMFEKIEDASSVSDLKEILHAIANKLGLE